MAGNYEAGGPSILKDGPLDEVVKRGLGGDKLHGEVDIVCIKLTGNQSIWAFWILEANSIFTAYVCFPFVSGASKFAKVYEFYFYFLLYKILC